MSSIWGALCLQFGGHFVLSGGGILSWGRFDLQSCAQRSAYEYCHLIRFAKDPKLCHFMVRNGEKEGPFSWYSCLFTRDLF